MYSIQVKCGDLQWSVMRRYRDFFKLHTTLLEELSNSDNPSIAQSAELIVPFMPPKLIVTPTSGEVVEKRKHALNEYLTDLLSLPTMKENIHVMSFLGGKMKQCFTGSWKKAVVS